MEKSQPGPTRSSGGAGNCVLRTRNSAWDVIATSRCWRRIRKKVQTDYVARLQFYREARPPVKVVWTREDDVKFDYYNAVAAMYLKQRSTTREAHGVAAEISLSTDHLHFRCERCLWRCAAPAQVGRIFPMIAQHTHRECPAQAHVRIGWLRSVANIYHAFEFSVSPMSWLIAQIAIQWSICWTLSDRAHIDFTNVQYPNYGADYKTYPWETAPAKVIEMVADKSGWPERRRKGHGFGFAAIAVS